MPTGSTTGRMMLLVTYRPGLDAQVLQGSRAAQTSIRLTPLTDAASAALLEGLLKSPGRGLPPALHSLVVGRAGGNPLYVVEIVRTLIDARVLTRGEDGWICARDVATLDVPATIQGLLLSRVDHLPVEARRLLQDAAVLGIGFDRDVLREMAGSEQRSASTRASSSCRMQN